MLRADLSHINYGRVLDCVKLPIVFDGQIERTVSRGALVTTWPSSPCWSDTDQDGDTWPSESHNHFPSESQRLPVSSRCATYIAVSMPQIPITVQCPSHTKAHYCSQATCSTVESTGSSQVLLMWIKKCSFKYQRIYVLLGNKINASITVLFESKVLRNIIKPLR